MKNVSYIVDDLFIPKKTSLYFICSKLSLQKEYFYVLNYSVIEKSRLRWLASKQQELGFPPKVILMFNIKNQSYINNFIF